MDMVLQQIASYQVFYGGTLQLSTMKTVPIQTCLQRNVVGVVEQIAMQSISLIALPGKG